MKVKIKHNSREKIKIAAGISQNLQATQPDIIKEFPIFNFQGGDFYMQGGNSNEDKTIETGFDLTSLLNEFETGTWIKFFLMLTENDPEATGTGEIISFSILDYTDEVAKEITCEQANVSIKQHDTTLLSLNYLMNFDDISIASDNIPPGETGELYTYQLGINGGTPPYSWTFNKTYREYIKEVNFPLNTGQQVYPDHEDTGYVSLETGFLFPFYGKEYNQINVYTDGFITLGDRIYHWPYLININDNAKYSCLIAPLMTDMVINNNGNDGLWFHEYQGEATIWWKGTANSNFFDSDVSCALKINASGNIQFFMIILICRNQHHTFQDSQLVMAISTSFQS